MGKTNFTFHLSPYDVDKLIPQASKALEKRMELLSQKRYPRLWRATDKLNAASQGRTRSKTRTKILSMIYLLLGIFLFVPGLMKPQELLIPLIIGAIGVCYGIFGLWTTRKGKKNRFEKSARLLLAGKDTFSAKQKILVSFSETGMTLPAVEGQTQSVPYSSFECIIETDDLFLLVHDTRATLLQKADLAAGVLSDLRAFLMEKAAQSGADYSQITG